MGESPAAQRSEQPGTQRLQGASSFRRGSAGREGSSPGSRATPTRAFDSAVLCRSSRAGLKGARRWRLPWSRQRPLSERSEDMSLSDRQRRGAFKMCWSDTESAVAMSLGVVPSKPAVPSQSVSVVPPAVPRVLPSEPPPPSTPSRVPQDSTPGPATPESPAGHTRDTRHSYPLRRPSVHAPAPPRASVPPSGGCPAVRRHTSQPPVSARPSVPR